MGGKEVEKGEREREAERGNEGECKRGNEGEEGGEGG